MTHIMDVGTIMREPSKTHSEFAVDMPLHILLRLHSQQLMFDSCIQC